MVGLVDLMAIAAEMVAMPLIAFAGGLALLLAMRKLKARVERRVGPPLLQPVYDIVKLYAKGSQVSHGPMMDIAIMLVVGGMVAVTLFLPVPGMDGLAAQGDLITLAYLLMVPSLGLALGVGQCANPNGSIGISRALSAMLAYDIPLMLVIAGVAIAYGTTDMPTILAAQQEQWGLLRMPLLAVAALIAVHTMLAKEPFEIYTAPAEIASGPMVEMGGKFLGALWVMQAFQLYVAGALFTDLFLGGGGNWLAFLALVAAVLAGPLLITNLFPRYRTEDVLRWHWKWPTTIALLGVAAVMLR
jgi:NADH-quinone oxidoreductase subunit H